MTFFDDSGSHSSEDWPSNLGGIRDESHFHPSIAPSQAVQLNDLRANRRCLSQALQSEDQPASDQPAKPAIQLRRRESLVVQQDQLWEIDQGFIKALTWDDQGCVLTLGIWGPGEFVGLPLGNIAPYQLTCITPVKVRSLQLNGGYPHSFLYSQAQQSQELLSLFCCRCLENRLLDLLWWLSSRFGKPVPAGYLTGIPLTHQELADVLGSTRVTMTRMLRELQDAGELERLDQRQILLKGKPRNRGIKPMPS